MTKTTMALFAHLDSPSKPTRQELVDLAEQLRVESGIDGDTSVRWKVADLIDPDLSPVEAWLNRFKTAIVEARIAVVNWHDSRYKDRLVPVMIAMEQAYPVEQAVADAAQKSE